MRPNLCAALLLCLLSGCASPGLTALMAGPLDACAPAYPDGRAKECLRDGRVLGTAPPSERWRCLFQHEAGRGEVRLQFWGDGERIGVVARGIAGAANPVGSLWLDGAGPIFWSAADGHLADLGARPVPHEWHFHLESFSVQPAGAPLAVRATEFDGDRWFVYGFPDGASADGMVQATVDGKPGPWVPAPAAVQTSEGPVRVDPHEVAAGSGWRVATPLDRLPELRDRCPA